MSGRSGDRPWYIAITASAGIHLGLIALAGWFVVSVAATAHPVDVEANWDAADATEVVVPLTTPPLEVGVGSNGGEPGQAQQREPGIESQSPLSVATTQQAQMPVHLATAAPSLTTNWLNESRGTKGLTDVVGPVVYGPDGSPEGRGGSGGTGGGSGGGLKTTFFGVHTAARKVVYVVDASNSMNRPYDGEAKTRFGQMKLELAKSILSLQAEQQFFVIFFNEHSNPMPAEGMENAFPQNQQKYIGWIASVPAYGLTDPRPAISLALSLNPDVVYLLTDGTFPRDVQSDLSRLRQQSVQLNTIAFGDPKAEKSLKSLALKNRGRFAFVP